MVNWRELRRIVGRAPSYVAWEIQREGLVGGVERATVAAVSHGYVNLFGSPGTAVWERDWDVLLVLDACRVDTLREVGDEYEFVGRESVDSTRSVASMSRDWLRNTFAAEYADEIRRTAYVTGNPFTAKAEMDVRPAILDEVWRYGWDEELQTIPARPITDRAIATWRDRPPGVDRMIVHYMQPHAPFVDRPELGRYKTPEEFGNNFSEIWPLVREGEIGYGEAMDACRDNLRHVLDDVALLRRNLDADALALTSDHGNAVGEWNVYGHPSKFLHPVIRRVPWVETDAADTGGYEPSLEPPAARDASDDEVAERLRNLGYTE